MLPAPHNFLFCPVSYIKQKIFLSIKIFDVLRVISRVREDVFPIVHTLHNLDISSGILRGPGIYYPLGTYCSLQSCPLGHVERVRPTHSSVVPTVSLPVGTTTSLQLYPLHFHKHPEFYPVLSCYFLYYPHWVSSSVLHPWCRPKYYAAKGSAFFYVPLHRCS